MLAAAQQKEKLIKEAIESFPETFGLRAFPNKVFRVSKKNSFWADSQNDVHLSVDIHLGDDLWCSFSNGSPQDVRKEMVKL